jgi:hypothetical protein
MSPLLAQSSAELYDLSEYPPALPELLADRAEEFFADSSIERKIYLDIMLDLLGSRREQDAQWRSTIEPDQWEDAISGKALHIKFNFDKMRGITNG